MKPFDLQAALAGAPVVTRDGRKVVRLAHFPEVDDCIRVIFVVEGSQGIWHAHENGHASSCGSFNSNLDLFMAHTKRTVWVNLYKSDHSTRPISVSDGFVNEFEADIRCQPNRIGGRAWPLPYEE